MHDSGKWSFLIPAAGAGIRLGLGAKAFVAIEGRSLIERAMEKAALVSEEVIIAVPEDTVDAVRSAYPAQTVIAGGTTRQNTVGKLLERATRDWIMVHDAARPFASLRLMRAVAEAAQTEGAACAFIPVDGPVAIIEGGLVAAHFRGDKAGIVESPLAFRRRVLADAHAFAAKEALQAPSTIEIVLAAGFPVRAIPGERDNIKITVPEDIPEATAIAARLQGVDSG